MAADDLNAPLRRGGAGRARSGRGRGGVRVSAVLLAGLAAVGVGLIAWPLMRDDPLAGEPVVIVDSKESRPDTAGVPLDGALAMRDSLGAEQDETDVAPPPANDDLVKITIHGGIVADADTGAAPMALPDAAASPPHRRLAKAPEPGLVEAGAAGALPRIGMDGRRPAEAYARPADTPQATDGKTPRIAILITGLGISAKSTEEAIRLAGPISLAFAPYGNNLQAGVDKARSRGHEVALQLPMEPFGYPDADPGPHTMLTEASATENLRRMRWLLGRMTGYFAVTNYMGAKFTASPQALSPVLGEAARRGLAYIDDGSSPRSAVAPVAGSLGLPAVTADLVIDAGQSPRGVEKALEELEALARERGQALGVGTALPATIEAVARWADGLRARGFVLVPVSALMPQQSRS